MVQVRRPSKVDFPMTFFPMRQVRQVCRIAAILLLACLPAAAQLTFSGKITVNTVNTTVDLVNPAHYDTTVISYDVSTPGMPCVQDLAELNAYLLRGCRQDEQRRIAGKPLLVGEAMGIERAHLLPMQVVLAHHLLATAEAEVAR